MGTLRWRPDGGCRDRPMSSPTDGSTYDELGELHDLFMTDAWERLRPLVSGVFGALGVGRTVVEIGAGTGVGTAVLADVCAAQVWALEPNRVMRAALTQRVAADPGLAPRVTVVAGSAPVDLGLLPAQIDGLLCAHVLGHLDVEARRELWSWLEDVLDHDGAVVLTVALPAPEEGPPEDISDEFVERGRLGRYDYRAVHLSADDGERSRTRYEVWHGPELVRESTVEVTWRTVGLDEIEAELHGTGLTCERIAPGVVRVMPGRPL